MDNIIKDQILTILKKHEFETEKFRFIEMKHNIFKLTYQDKFITYIETLGDIKINNNNNQVKKWKSYRPELVEHIKKVIDNTIYDIVCIVDIIDNCKVIDKTLESLKLQKKEPHIILVATKSDHKNIAIKHNIEFYWSQESNTTARISSCIKSSKTLYNFNAIMLSNSNDIFQDSWITDCYYLIAKKKYEVVGRDFSFILENDMTYRLDINQEQVKTMIKTAFWKNMCLSNGMLLSTGILKKINWNLESDTFSNINLAIHDRIIKINPVVTYIQNSYLISIYDDYSSYTRKDLLKNNYFILLPIEKLPIPDTYIFGGFNINFLRQKKIIGAPHEKHVPYVKKDEPETTKEEVVIPMIIKKKTEIKKQEIKLENKQSIPVTNQVVLAPQISTNLFVSDELQKKRKDILSIYRNVGQITSPNRIMTLILVKNKTEIEIIERCIKNIKEQLMPTDILFLISDHKFKTFFDKSREHYLLCDEEGDTFKIQYGLSYIQNMNPYFVMIINDYDLLTPGWTKECYAKCKKQNIDVIGSPYHYVYRNKELCLRTTNKEKLLHVIPAIYRNDWSITNGRFIFNRILHEINWTITTNMNIDFDVAFAMKFLEKQAKFGKVTENMLLSVPKQYEERDFINNTYLELESVKNSKNKDLLEIRKLHDRFNNILGPYDETQYFKQETQKMYLKTIELKKEEKEPEIQKSIFYRKIPEHFINNIENVYNGDDEFIRDIYNLDIDSDEIVDKQNKFGLDNSNKIVQGLWLGPQLGIFEQMCILSFINCGHEFHLYIYERTPKTSKDNEDIIPKKMHGIPNGCIKKDGNEIVSEDDIFYYSEKQSLSGKKRITAFSNLFRYKLLHDKGGYWVDLDMICLRPFNFQREYVFSSEWTGSKQQVNAGVMKCPAKCDFAKYCYEYCENKDKSQIQWGELGPKLVEKGVEKFSLHKYVQPWEVFCPMKYNDINKALDPYIYNISNKWYAMHLWNELWNKQERKLNKSMISMRFIAQVLYNINIPDILNRDGVLIEWFPIDEYIRKFNNNLERRILEFGNNINYKLLDQYLDTDIYVDIMKKLRDSNLINNIHVVFSVNEDDSDCYGNKFNMFNCTHLYYQNIHFWKFHNLSDFNLFKTASLVINRGYRERMLNLCNFNKYGSFVINYPATAFNQEIINHKLCSTGRAQKSLYNYDVILIDETDKLDIYRQTFPNVNHFVNFYKTGFSKKILKSVKVLDRQYDIIHNGSLAYPTKNTDLFLRYLTYLDNKKYKLNVCIVTKFDDQKTKERLNYNNLQVDLIINEDMQGMVELFSSSKNNLIFSGRDANPRIISEGLSCGCYCICLNSLSDGYGILVNNPLFGTVVEGNKMLISDDKNMSGCCVETADLFAKITAKLLEPKDHETIKNKFNSFIANKYSSQINRLYEIYTKSTKNAYILTLATPNYLGPMNYLLSSIKYTNPSLPVVVICVNCNAFLLNQFIFRYPEYKIINYQIDPNYQKKDILLLKVKMQRYFFNTFEKPFLWIDADTIVVKKLDKLLHDLYDYNLMVCTRFNDNEYFRKFAVGVIGYGFGNDIDKTKDLLNAYYKEILITTGFNDWYHDQISLLETYNEHKNLIKLYELKDIEHSLTNNPNSAIISRRSKGEEVIVKKLAALGCPVADIDFADIKMAYDY